MASAAEQQVPAQAPEQNEKRASQNKLWTVCIFILVVEMCERLCYYTLAGSQRNFVEDVGPRRDDGTRGLEQSTAFSLSSCFSMLSYVTCLLGGYMADNVFGRFKTILIFSVVYACGVAVVTLSAEPRIMSSNLGLPLYLFGALGLVSLGTGAIKPNVMNFGADQYDASSEEEKRQQKSFFSYFYLMINVGVVFAFGFNVNIATSGSTSTSAGSGYFDAYLIAAAAMCLAVLAFVAGSSRYSHKGGVTPSPVLSVLRSHLWHAAKGTAQGVMALVGWCLLPIYMGMVMLGALPGIGDSVTWEACALAVLSNFLLIFAHRDNSYITSPTEDGAAKVPPASSASTISTRDVQAALACVPTILCVNIGFNVCYNAMNNAYPAQACQMNTLLFGVQINGAFFNLGDAAAIIVGVPILEKIVLPMLERARGGLPVTDFAKFAAGFACVILANVSAIAIEFERRRRSIGVSAAFVSCPSDLLGSEQCEGVHLLSKCSPGGSLRMTDMSAFWTFLPMTLTGIGEILVNPVVYSYVFSSAPKSLSSITQSLNLVASGAISNAITASFGPLVPQNFNVGYLNYYFIANIVVALLFFGILCCVKQPQLKEDTAKQVEAPESVELGGFEVPQTTTATRAAGV